MQLGLILPEHQCQQRFPLLALTALAAVVLTLASAWVSWRSTSTGSAGRFWSRLSAGAALVFAFALLLQCAAGFMLSGCET
jgi:uncharacterized membrane protein